MNDGALDPGKSSAGNVKRLDFGFILIVKPQDFF